MSAAWLWARLDIRRRWVSIGALMLVAGLAGGGVLALVAGARRTSTAYERFRDETRASDLNIAPSGPAPDEFAEIEQLPQVAAFAYSAYPFIVPKDSGLYPYLDFLAAAGPDDSWFHEVDRPRVVDGRFPDATRADEMAVTERFAREAGLTIGDHVEFDSYAPDQIEALFSTGDAGPPAGPGVTLRVTGVVSIPELLSESGGNFFPRVFLTPTFYARYVEDIGMYPGGVSVRLRRGAADESAVVEAAREIFRADPEVEIQAASESASKIDDSLDVAVFALLLCALAAAVAGGVAVMQALARHLSLSIANARQLGALGMSSRARVVALTTSVLPVAVGGSAVAIVVAVLLSPLMPIGVARRAEPDRGWSFDGTVLVIGAIGVALLVLGSCIVAAWRANRVASSSSSTVDPVRKTMAARVFTAASASPARAIGARAAFETRKGSSTSGTRSALLGVAMAIGGVVGVSVYVTSQDALVESRARQGFPWDARVIGFEGADLVGAHADALGADPDVRDAGALATSIARIDGNDVNIHAFEVLKGEGSLSVIEGRLPRDATEVALGTSTLRTAGADIGDEIELEGAAGAVELRIVGRAALPIIDERSAINRGAVLTTEALEELAPADSVNVDLVVTWAPGVDDAVATRELGERTGAEVATAIRPADVNNLEQVDTILLALAAFFATLGVLALIHTLLTNVRGRRHDIAVLRALGFTRPQVGSVVSWQAATIAAAGLLVGVPIGIAAGRAAWTAVANSTGVVPAPTGSILVFAIVVFATMAVALAVAAIPARMARRTRTGVELRTD